ncbi:MASE1 domain-containing protein [Cupriavidus sp. CP313]
MQQIRLAVTVGVLVLLAACVSRTLGYAATETVPVWLGSGVTFAALLVCARWSWPAVLAGAGIALAGWGAVIHGLPLPGAAAFGLIEVISLGTAGWIATYGRRDPQSPLGATLLIAGALVGAALGATLAVELWRWQRPGLDLPIEWRAWFFSTAAGLLLVAPVVVAFRGFRVRRSGGMPMQQFAAGGLAFILFVLAVLVVFSDHATQRFGGLASTLAYVPMPFLLATALLWGPRGGAVATLFGCLLIIYRTAGGAGPFNIIEGFPGEAVVEVQGFVIVWALVMLLGRALSEGRRSALEDARAWRLRYARTLQAVGVASVEYDAVTGRATWGEGAAELLGGTIRQVNSVDEWLDRVDAAERGLVQANWSAVARGDTPDSVQEYAVTLPDSGKVRIHERLAGIRGADGQVEQVAALLRRATPEPAHG